MKKILKSALLLVFAACTLNTMADTAVLSMNMGENGAAAASANSITGAAGCDAEGFTIAITGKTDKNWSAGNGSITYNGTTYTTLKNSNGAQNTVTLPTGMYASKVEFIATTNADTGNGVLNEFNGSSTSDAVNSNKDYANPTSIVKMIATPVNSFTFTFGTKQVCFIAIVTYSSDATPVCAEPQIAFGAWDEANHGFPTTITSNEAGVTLYYAVNGGEYTAYSAPFIVAAEAVVTAKATKAGYSDSDIATETAPMHADGDAPTTITWLVGNEATPTVVSGKAEYIAQAKVTAGTGLTTGTKNNYAANNGNTMVTYVPATSNAGNDPSVMIEYSVNMKKGVTFALTSVSYDALKAGTDGASFSWTYTVDGNESDNHIVTQDNLIRDNNTSNNPPLNHVETINAAAGRKVTVRFFVSGFANTKTFALSNVQLNGIISGDPEVRTFTDFKVEFRDDPYTVILPASGTLPDGVTIAGTTYNGVQHGIYGGTITVPVDGPVKFTIGACQHSGGDIAIKKDGADYMTVSNIAPCGEVKPNYNQFVTWTYNVEEAATLTFVLPGNVYVPYFFAEATDYVPQAEVRYYDIDGTTLIGSEIVDGGTPLVYLYDASSVTVASGKAFRGWFASANLDAVKIPAGTIVTEDISLCAHTSDIEVPAVGKIFEYDLRKPYFYPEDHEAFAMTGAKYKDAQHGWQFNANGTITLDVAGNAVIKLSLCKHGNAGTIVCTDGNGTQVGDAINIPLTNDGDGVAIRYNGPATTLTLTLNNGGYIHIVKVFNVDAIPEKNAAGYYVMGANDGAGLLLILDMVQDGDKIFLPNGTYDFANATLTEINYSISIIGQSMMGVNIVNHPLTAGMNNSETLHLRGTNIYMQDLGVRCDVSYEGSIAGGVGIALQDRGDKNILKRVNLQGNQDTYLSSGHPSQRGWIEDGRIEGTVDYICGGGNIWFENIDFYNNARSNADVIFAPNTDAATVYGYVVNNATIDGDAAQAGKWNLARGWQKSPAVTFLNTTCLIAPSAQGYTHMSEGLVCRFHELNTHLEDGTAITGHNLDGLNYSASSDAIYLSDAGVYTYANVILGDDNWDAKTIAADAVADEDNIDADGAYLIEDEGAFIAVLKGSELNPDEYAGKTMRKANSRGGFGQPVEIKGSGTGLENVVDRALMRDTKVLRDGQLLIIRDGKTYSAQGQLINK